MKGIGRRCFPVNGGKMQASSSGAKLSVTCRDSDGMIERARQLSGESVNGSQ